MGRIRLSRLHFERLVLEVLESLPDEFQDRLQNIAVLVEEEPPDDAPGIFGLYEGVPLTERALSDMTLPDRITLYKGPIERSCSTEQEIADEVRLTVLHEVGHFFGLDEDDLDGVL